MSQRVQIPASSAARPVTRHPKSSAPKRKQRSNAWANASALLQFLRLEQLPLGPKPVLLVAAGLLRLGDQVCPFGDPLPRNPLTRGTRRARISFPCAGSCFGPFCGVGIVFHNSLLIERSLARPSVDAHVILASLRRTEKSPGFLILGRRPTPMACRWPVGTCCVSTHAHAHTNVTERAACSNAWST